ncbi:hypothetical protein SLEP1_g35688 [Rubroshorea leprosula]|uniref:Uncharacterized protein n=1 Tax=Rubroshorea leprosula TaxID=152421 RepID=A0AAV5KPJ0_9ROSI|nr:hypothetical protein SLEP1_g35688 [Rubroshorea leprosula]
MIWSRQFPEDLFSNIKGLRVLCYHSESKAFPFFFIERFFNLEKLFIGCSHFKELFRSIASIDCQAKDGRWHFRIRKLKLDTLPNLKKREEWWSKRLGGTRFSSSYLGLLLLSSILNSGSLRLRGLRFINTTFPKVDKHQAKEEVLKYCGATVVKHALECEQLQKEKEELEKKKKDMQEVLDEVVPTVKQLEQEKDSLSTKLVFEEKKRKIYESECEAQEKEIKAMKEAVVELKKNVQLLVHNGMEEHISNFVNSSLFDNIVNLYRLPIAILAFTNCRRKAKAECPKVDITKITFGEQEEGVEENGETVEEEEAEVEGVGVEENQPPHPVEVHSIPSDEEQPPQLVEWPPLPSE